MPKQLQIETHLQVHDLPVQDLRESVKIEEGKHSGTSRVKKKPRKDQRKSTCKRKKMKEISDRCQVVEMTTVKL